MEEILNQRRECILNHFANICSWSKEEACQTRRVSIECFGLPLHAWSFDNLREIGRTWGTVECIDQSTEDGVDFS